MKSSPIGVFTKYFICAAVALLAQTIPSVAQVTTIPVHGPNLAKNNGFESGDEGWNLRNGSAKVVTDAARSGKNSLYYENTDVKQYKFFTQRLDVKPGRHLSLSAWIKGEGLDEKRGAGIFVQSYDANHKYISLGMSNYGKGTFDWTQVEGDYVVPANAAQVEVGLMLRNGTTGKVWFDDIEVREQYPAPFDSSLQYPNYRKTTESSPWKYRIAIKIEPNWRNEPIQVFTELVNSDGKVLLEQKNETSSQSKTLEVALKEGPRELPLGDYILKQRIVDPNGRERLSSRQVIHVVTEIPQVYVDTQGFTVVDGKRFFVHGIYNGWGLNSDEHMTRIRNAGFNAILGNESGAKQRKKAYLDRARKHDLKIVYNMSDLYPGDKKHGEEVYDEAADLVRQLKDDPALLAWYTNDEKGPEWLPKLKKLYGIVKAADSDHPTFQVLDKAKYPHLREYFDVTDILGGDPYPVGGTNLTDTTKGTQKFLEVTRGGQGIWMVAQMMDWGTYEENRKMQWPSRDEMRNQAYQMLIHGAKGLMWFSYNSVAYSAFPGRKNIDNSLFEKRWPDVTAMAQEINEFTPVILQDEKVQLDVPANAAVEAGAWKAGDKLAILFANPYYETQSVTFPLPEGWTIKDANQGQIESTLSGGKATFTLPSVGSGVFYLEKGLRQALLMSRVENPNQYEGSDAQRIQQAIDAAESGSGRVVIPRVNQGRNAPDSGKWLLDEAIRLPSNITVELDNCHLKLSDRSRDNFFRSANCGIGIAPIEPAENIHLIGRGRVILEGADRPRATGDRGKVLGERTYGTDAGVAGESQRGDWRNVGILLASVSGFSIQNIHIVDSHCWAISLEYCSHGTLRDLSFNSRGKKVIDGREETILNQDGLDLRRGCHDILVENISGQTGDDLIALTATLRPGRQAGKLESTSISAEQETAFPGIHNVIIRNVRGHSAGGHQIVRLLNTRGLPMENISLDGLIDTSLPPYQSRVALKIGDTKYGGISPLGTTRRILVNNVISRARFAVLIGGSLCDSSISNVLQNGGANEPIYFESGAENIRNVAVHNVHTFSDDN